MKVKPSTTTSCGYEFAIQVSPPSPVTQLFPWTDVTQIPRVLADPICSASLPDLAPPTSSRGVPSRSQTDPASLVPSAAIARSRSASADPFVVLCIGLVAEATELATKNGNAIANERLVYGLASLLRS